MIIDKRMLPTALLAVLGALLFLLLHIPLAWLLGPLVATMVWRFFRKTELYWSSSLRDFGLVLMGYMLGASFTKETALHIVQHIPLMTLNAVVTIGFSLLMGYFTSKALKLDLASSLLGSVPGGLSQMVALSEELKGLDTTLVTYLQTIRVTLVILVVPFITLYGISDYGAAADTNNVGGSLLDFELWASYPWYSYALYPLLVYFGVWGGSRLGIPAATTIGPLLLTAVVVVLGLPAPPLPAIAIILAQIFIGTQIGLKMKLANLTAWKKIGLATILGSFLLIGMSLLLAWGLTSLYSAMSITTAFLSTSPGGIAEMGIAGASIGADLATISSYQLVRIFIVLLAIPPLFHWWVRRYRKSA